MISGFQDFKDFLKSIFKGPYKYFKNQYFKSVLFRQFKYKVQFKYFRQWSWKMISRFQDNKLHSTECGELQQPEIKTLSHKTHFFEVLTQLKFYFASHLSPKLQHFTVNFFNF